MPVKTAPCNRKGFSLIELLIAVIFISISMLAVLTSMTTAMRVNLDNDVRNTAIRLTNQTAEILRALQWAEVDKVVYMDEDLTTGSHTRSAGSAEQDAKGFPSLSQILRNFQQDYEIGWMVDDLTLKSKRITITVTYTRNGRSLSNGAVVFRNMRREVKL